MSETHFVSFTLTSVSANTLYVTRKLKINPTNTLITFIFQSAGTF